MSRPTPLPHHRREDEGVNMDDSEIEVWICKTCATANTIMPAAGGPWTCGQCGCPRADEPYLERPMVSLVLFGDAQARIEESLAEMERRMRHMVMRDRALEEARRKRDEYRRREIAALQNKCRQRRLQVKELLKLGTLQTTRNERMTTTTTEHLKPCPFCGYDQPEPAVLKDGARIVRCPCCGAYSGRFYNIAGTRQAATRAAEAWNRRKEPEA